MDKTQEAIEALSGLEFQFSKLSDKDWTATFEIIRTALRPVDVDLTDVMKIIRGVMPKDIGDGYLVTLPRIITGCLQENGYRITKEDK